MEGYPKITNRVEFINFINDTLTKKRFEKDSEKDLWRNARDIQHGGGQVIVNGQVQREISPEIHHLEAFVEVFGEGSICDVGGGNPNPFIEINFYAKDNGVKQELGPTYCMFFDDQMLFNSVLNKIFGL